MPRTSSLASVVIDVSEEPERLLRPEPDAPFRILVVGDLSGDGSRRQGGAGEGKPVAIDRDNFEDVMARFAPELRLRFGNAEIAARFRELDDFHPDRLFERLEPFRAMRDLRRRLSDRSTFPAAAAQMSSIPASETPPETTAASGADVLRRMMGEEPAPASVRSLDDWSRMLNELVAPYVEPRPDPKQAEAIEQLDAAIAGQMRTVLHSPAFQALEAAWRGLFFLVRRLDTGENLRLHVADLPPSEVASAEGVAMLRKWAVDEAAQMPGADPWTVIVGLYEFEPGDEALLAKLADVAADAGAPLLAGAHARVLGIESLDGSTDPRRWNGKAFEALRRSSRAQWIGLALPRFLARLPYGRSTDATELFSFEEMPGAPRHEDYLWANPAIACAWLLGEAFSRSGWEFRPGEVQDIENLPAHVYRAGGESELKPCAEVLLTESAAEEILERGIMPLLSLKGTDRVRLARFQSVADPLAPLAGRWQ